MANFFDQFDSPAPAATPAPAAAPATGGNFFDQFDAPSAAGANPPATLKKNYSVGEALSAAKQNLGPDALAFATNMRDTLLHPIKTAKGLVKMAASLPLQVGENIGAALAGGSMTPEVQAELAAKHPHIQSVADSLDYFDRYGNPQKALNNFAEHPVQTLTDISTVVPALNPIHVVTRPVGALARATGVSRAAAGVARNVADALVVPENINPFAGPVRGPIGPTRVAQNALMLDAAENPAVVQNALANAQPILPGSPMNAAEAAADTGATRLAALTEGAKRNLPSAAFDANAGKNAARLAAIQQIGQTPADLEAAIQARGAQAAHDYDVANQIPVRADDDLHDLLFARPSMPEVINRAERIAQERGEQFQIGQNARAQTVPSTVLGPNGQPMTMNVPAQYATYPTRSLHTVKQAFDDLISNPEQFGIGATEVDALRGTRREVLDWLESHNPAYANARQNYAAASVPINQMQIGQYLQRKLMDPTLGEDTVTPRANSFSNALDNATNEALGNSTVRRATGQTRYRALADVMAPQQMQILQSIQDDLARSMLAEKQASRGSQYTGALNTAASDALVGGLPGQVHPIVNWLLRGSDRRIADTVGNALLTPHGANALLTQALDRQQQINRARDVVNALGRNSVGRLNRSPAVYNALQQTTDQRKKK